jgi:type VI secretion system protein ImpH
MKAHRTLEQGGSADATTELLGQLRASATKFDFFDLVRLLEHALACHVGVIDRHAPQEPISFVHSPDLAFPPFDVAWLDVEGNSVRVGATFLGLLGTASPLTPEWTEEVLHADEDGTLRAFYDVFHHRAYALLYRAWKEHALEGGFDLEGGDILSKRLRSMAGIDAWGPAGEEPLPAMAAVGLADHQRGQPQTIDVDSAQALLRRIFPEWNVRLEPNVPRFVSFTPGERAKLGIARSALGVNLVYGDGCQDREGLVRIHVGPVGEATYHSLMPEGGEYRRLERLVDWIFAGAVDVELEVQIQSEDAPSFALGKKNGGRLGIDTRYTAEKSAALRVRVPLSGDPANRRRTFVH